MVNTDGEIIQLPGKSCPRCNCEGDQVPLYVETWEDLGVTLTMKQQYRVRSAEIPGLCESCSSTLMWQRWMAVIVFATPLWGIGILSFALNSPGFLILAGMYALHELKNFGYSWADRMLYGYELEAKLRDRFSHLSPEGTSIKFPVGFFHSLLRLLLIAVSSFLIFLGAATLGSIISSGKGGEREPPENIQPDNSTKTPFEIACTLIKKKMPNDLGKFVQSHPELKNFQDSNGISLMHFAANADDPEVIRQLADNGCLVDLTDKIEGFTPLHWASRSGNCPAVESLIKAGAKLNLHSKNGHTPLHITALYGQKAACEVLLKNHAEVNAKTSTGRTPLYFAHLKKFHDIAKIIADAHGTE